MYFGLYLTYQVFNILILPEIKKGLQEFLNVFPEKSHVKCFEPPHLHCFAAFHMYLMPTCAG